MRKVLHASIGPAGLPLARVYESGLVSKPYGEFLCDALSSDFQEVEFCQEHMNSVLAVVQQKEPSTEWVGNAYAIEVSNEIAAFSNELTGEKGGELPAYEYLSALALWKRFLRNPSRPFEGEIAATSEEAIRIAIS